jgi:hypothetical protein
MKEKLLQLITELHDDNRQSISIAEARQQPPPLPGSYPLPLDSLSAPSDLSRDASIQSADGDGRTILIDNTPHNNDGLLVNAAATITTTGSIEQLPVEQQAAVTTTIYNEEHREHGDLTTVCLSAAFDTELVVVHRPEPASIDDDQEKEGDHVSPKPINCLMKCPSCPFEVVKVPYTMMRFASFETIVEMIKKQAASTKKSECSKQIHESYIDQLELRF